MEPRRLRRKLASLLTTNPSNLLRNIRLEKSKKPLEQRVKPAAVFELVRFST